MSRIPRAALRGQHRAREHGSRRRLIEEASTSRAVRTNAGVDADRAAIDERHLASWRRLRICERATPKQIEDLDGHDRLLFTPGSRNQTWTLVNGDASTSSAGRRGLRVTTTARSASRGRRRRRRAVDGLHGLRRPRSGTLMRMLPQWADATDRGPCRISRAPKYPSAPHIVSRTLVEVAEPTSLDKTQR